jgi:hypothetical protein
MKSTKNSVFRFSIATVAVLTLVLTGCASDKTRNRAKEMAAKYWQDKAYPGKSYDVQVVDAEEAGDGMWRVKGMIDGETRVGMFNPETESFTEGFYTMAKEKERRVAELEQEVKYYKEKSESLEKEIFKLKVKLNMPTDDKAAPKGN